MGMKTILIVEDQLADLFKQIIAIGREGQYQVEDAETGTEAVRKANVLRPDLIIMDLNLPRMNGIRAIKEIRKFDKTVPILAVTAYSDKYSREFATEAGANEYLVKPFNIPDLLATITTLLKESI